MKTIVKILLVTVFTVIMGSCSDDNTNSLIEIRVENASNFKFDNIYIHPSSSFATGQGNKNYGNLNPNSFSEYKNFDFAFPYGAVQITIDNNKYTLKPIDFVGEEPLKSGKYTYKITANTSSNEYEKLNLIVIKD